jgi:hypothetical protein
MKKTLMQSQHKKLLLLIFLLLGAIAVLFLNRARPASPTVHSASISPSNNAPTSAVAAPIEIRAHQTSSQPSAEPLLTRVFRLDEHCMNFFNTQVNRNDPKYNKPIEQYSLLARQFFTRAGIDFQKPGASISLNDQTRQLSVRISAKDLVTLEKAIADLGAR